MFIFQENLCPQHFVCCLYINSANRLLLGFLLTAFLLRALNPLYLFHMDIQIIKITFKFCHKQSKIKKVNIHTTACNAIYQSFSLIYLFLSPSDERITLSKI